MKPSRMFPDPLRFEEIGRVDGSISLQLTHRFRYYSPFGTITVPLGFVTDGASVPRPLWPLASPFDNLGPPVVHDWLYSKNNTEFTRSEADYIFLQGMTDAGVSFWKRMAIYSAVKLCGWRYYKGLR